MRSLVRHVPSGPDARPRVVDALAARPDRLRYIKSSVITEQLPDVPWPVITTMAQDFVTRHPLVDGVGNFGSIDGDPPADPRYTEMRLSALGQAVADGAPFPERLVNGLDGIPPHNLGEVVAAMLAMRSTPRIDAEGLLEYLPGPDFPTGGFVDRADARAAYVTGAGTIATRGRLDEAEIVVSIGGLSRKVPGFVITELPHGVAKGGEDGVLMEMVEAVSERRLRLRTLEDHSSPEGGMRVEIALGDGEDATEARAVLLRETSLQVEVEVAFDVRSEIGLALTHPAADPDTLRDMVERFGDDRRTVLE